MNNKKVLLKEVEKFSESVYWRSSIEEENGVPFYIKNNMKQRYRPYQNQSIENLMIFLSINPSNDEFHELFNFYNNDQLLFRMATGSGKTNVMGGAILALYKEKKIQRFLFTTNLKSVLKKTENNLFDEMNKKYLFTSPIIIEGQTIKIVEVSDDEEFPDVEPNTIYIKIASIQNLLTQLDPESIKENRITIQDLASSSLGIIVDEAHHFNKNAKSTTIQMKNEDSKSFEETMDTIRNAVKNNGHTVYQLEFTATMPFGETGYQKNLSDKYVDKLIFDYNLTDFIENNGYGKKLAQIETSFSDDDNMLTGILLSQFRKGIALKYGFENFKPVILFKSNYKSVSRDTELKFINNLRELTVERLDSHLKMLEKSESDTIRKMISHFRSYPLEITIDKLREDFDGYTLNANDDINDDDLLINNLNTLDDVNNPYRAVFAVERVSEGWDVLNLYDIIRINEKTPNKPKTNGEAQLVGRGARYYPLKHKNGFTLQRQTFNIEKNYYEHNIKEIKELNEEEKSTLSLLETMHYHTLQEPNYLKSLRESYSMLGIPVSFEQEILDFRTQLKKNFMESYFYKEGYFIENTLTDPTPDMYTNLESYGVHFDFSVTVSNKTTENVIFQQGKIYDIQWQTTKLKIDKSYIIEAMDRISFYRFNIMKNFMPNLYSKSSFINGEEWLGQWDKFITFKHYRNEELTPELILSGVVQVLSRIAGTIQKNYLRKTGTKTFRKVKAKEYLPSYYSRSYKKRTDIDYQTISLINQKYSPYTHMIVDGLERELVNYLRYNIIPKFSINKDTEENIKVYLIRNDEIKNGMKLYEVNGTRTFYPDFLLHITNERPEGLEIIQLYIEPKGEHLFSQDQWKEDLLQSLGSSIDTSFKGETESFILMGVKFYTGKADLEILHKEIHEKLNIEEDVSARRLQLEFD